MPRLQVPSRKNLQSTSECGEAALVEPKLKAAVAAPPGSSDRAGWAAPPPLGAAAAGQKTLGMVVREVAHGAAANEDATFKSAHGRSDFDGGAGFGWIA